jgi:hypothetical protein
MKELIIRTLTCFLERLKSIETGRWKQRTGTSRKNLTFLTSKASITS